jgi:hypothetical protein
MPLPAPVKDQPLAVLLAPSPPSADLGARRFVRSAQPGPQLPLSMRRKHTFPLLRFKISKASDRLAGNIDTDIFRCSVRVADQGCDAACVEDAIKITTCCLGSISELVARSFDLHVGIVGLLQPFCSFVRLFEQLGVTLRSSGALSKSRSQPALRRMEPGDRDGPSGSPCLGMPEVVIPHRVFRPQLPG